MKDIRLRLSPIKTTAAAVEDAATAGPFGHLEESEPEEASSVYQQPFAAAGIGGGGGLARRQPSPEYRKLVKNYSCGRLCDYEEFGALNQASQSTAARFGSTPLFNLPSTSGVGTGERLLHNKPTTSKSFTSNLFEKDYRKPSFDPGYSVPVR